MDGCIGGFAAFDLIGAALFVCAGFTGEAVPAYGSGFSDAKGINSDTC